MVSERVASAWVGAGILAICYAFSTVDRLVVSLFVEPIKADLALTDLQISLILGPAFAILYATLGIPLGRVADIANRRNLVAASIAIWSLFTTACGLSWSFLTLFLSRVGVGVGEAGLTPAALSMLADQFKPNKLARAVGIYTTGGIVGGGLAFIIGGALYSAFEVVQGANLPIIGRLASWQLTLVTLGAVGLLVSFAAWYLLREPARRGDETKASFGAVFSLLRSQRGSFGWVFAAYAALCTFIYGYTSWLPAYLIRTFDLSVSVAGEYLGVIVLVTGIIGPLIAGWLADRWQPAHGAMAAMRTMIAFGIVLALCSALAFQMQNFSVVLAAVALMGLLATGMMVLVPTTVQMLTPGRMRGQMSGVGLMIGNLVGQGIGPPGVALVAEHALPAYGLRGGMTLMLTTSALLAVIAAVCAARSRSTPEGSHRAGPVSNP